MWVENSQGTCPLMDAWSPCSVVLWRCFHLKKKMQPCLSSAMCAGVGCHLHAAVSGNPFIVRDGELLRVRCYSSKPLQCAATWWPSFFFFIYACGLYLIYAMVAVCLSSATHVESSLWMVAVCCFLKDPIMPLYIPKVRTVLFMLDCLWKVAAWEKSPQDSACVDLLSVRLLLYPCGSPLISQYFGTWSLKSNICVSLATVDVLFFWNPPKICCVWNVPFSFWKLTMCGDPLYRACVIPPLM